MAWFAAKEWKNRLVEFAGRRSLKNVSTNETTVYDVTRNEGQVSQEGDSFSATTMNDLEQRISEGFSAAEEANSQLSSEFQDWFGVTADGRRGWKESGADTVYPFFKTVEIAGAVTLEKVGGPNDDRVHARIEAPDGFEISKIIYSSSGFSTNMYYNFNVGGTTIGNQERSNVTNRELDISSAQDRSFLQVLIRQYNESSSGTGSVNYTIQFERKAG